MKELERNYKDRGMMKWAGFYLSEHSAEQEEQKRIQSTVYPQKPKMEPEEIEQVLLQAQVKNKQVALQQEIVDEDGAYGPDVTGFVRGADAIGLLISNTKVPYDSIRHVELVQATKWSAL